MFILKLLKNYITSYILLKIKDGICKIINTYSCQKLKHDARNTNKFTIFLLLK